MFIQLCTEHILINSYSLYYQWFWQGLISDRLLIGKALKPLKAVKRHISVNNIETNLTANKLCWLHFI